MSKKAYGERNLKFETLFKEILDKYGIEKYLENTLQAENGYQEYYFERL